MPPRATSRVEEARTEPDQMTDDDVEEAGALLLGELRLHQSGRAEAGVEPGLIR
jgi:hypothetical protein